MSQQPSPANLDIAFKTACRPDSHSPIIQGRRIFSEAAPGLLSSSLPGCSHRPVQQCCIQIESAASKVTARAPETTIIQVKAGLGTVHSKETLRLCLRRTDASGLQTEVLLLLSNLAMRDDSLLPMREVYMDLLQLLHWSSSQVSAAIIPITPSGADFAHSG